MFRDTITCPSCREHFTSMLAAYRTAFPNMLASRQDFAVFTFRAHNAVNRRLRKPLFTTLEECMATLKSNIKTRSALDFRVSYVNHITRHWRTFQDVTGITALKKIAEMKKIELDYVAPRDRNFDVALRADVVVLPQDMLEKKTESEAATPFRLSSQVGGGGFRITAGGLRLRM
jgi:methyl coenzyme M reductase subunit C-like uncharacterized protein (methanogenesis marker protein 7)